jgi:predicted permease
VVRLSGDPNIAGKLLFAIGFRLPQRNREWVRHELTDAGWRGRLILRHLVLVIPVCAVFALLPGAAWIRVAVPALFAICSLGIVAMYADEIRASRLRRHGLDAPAPRRPPSSGFPQ